MKHTIYNKMLCHNKICIYNEMLSLENVLIKTCSINIQCFD